MLLDSESRSVSDKAGLAVAACLHALLQYTTSAAADAAASRHADAPKPASGPAQGKKKKGSSASSTAEIVTAAEAAGEDAVKAQITNHCLAAFQTESRQDQVNTFSILYVCACLIVLQLS